mgnify:CR=1 FL=1|jgi:hypothetical protein
MNPRKMASTRYSELEQNVREYFQEHKVPRELRGMIIQYYEYRFPDRKLYDLQKVSGFSRPDPPPLASGRSDTLWGGQES